MRALLVAWMAACGSLTPFLHTHSHTGNDKDDPLPIGNDGADRMAVAGAKAGGGGTKLPSGGSRCMTNSAQFFGLRAQHGL